MVKKQLLPLLSLLFCLGLASCGKGGVQETSPPTAAPAELARAVLESQTDRDGLEALTEEERKDHLTALCGLEDWEDAAVYAASGMDAREITVVLLEDDSAAEDAAEKLEQYRVGRVGDFFGYAPQEAERLESAAVFSSGRYAALLVCGDGEAARTAFDACLAGEPLPVVAPAELEIPTPGPAESATPEETPAPLPTPEPTPAVTPTPEPAPEPTPAQVPASPEPTPREVVNPGMDISGYIPFDPPNETDMTLYDTTAIRAAWESGDASGLSGRDADILARCREVLGELITDGMTDFEKELAVHDWLVAWGSYDRTVYNTASHTGRVGYKDPYGMLVGGYGICLGYATTFQLLMDLCGVECVTVVGASANSTSDHAWNMVRLDGEWYCVDPTWDDPTMGSGESNAFTRHRYFNVTSEQMRETNHQWDYLYVPEATGVYYRWDGVSDLPAPRGEQAAPSENRR